VTGAPSQLQTARTMRRFRAFPNSPLALELPMNKPETPPKVWSKPELKRLGTIRDVAGAEIVGSQAANGKKS